MCGDRLTQKNTLKKCMTCKISKGKPGGESEIQKKEKKKEKERTNNRGIKKKNSLTQMMQWQNWMTWFLVRFPCTH